MLLILIIAEDIWRLPHGHTLKAPRTPDSST